MFQDGVIADRRHVPSLDPHAVSSADRVPGPQFSWSTMKGQRSPAILHRVLVFPDLDVWFLLPQLQIPIQQLSYILYSISLV
jgi:hypothetical protein